MRCQITLKPVMKAGAVERMEISYLLEGHEPKCGQQVCRAQVNTVSIPGCVPQNMKVTDALGEVALEVSEAKPYPYHFMDYAAARDTQGAMQITYTVTPRPLGPEDKCGPYFDLKAEQGGANGAGMHFLVTVEGCEGDISLCWDTSAMEEGCCGVCSLGEGDVRYAGTLEKLTLCYYAFGHVKSLTDGDFGFYWLSEPNFDVQSLADYSRKLFGKLSSFFKDDTTNYRIFMRKDP